jgi:hypothetical protein
LLLVSFRDFSPIFLDSSLSDLGFLSGLSAPPGGHMEDLISVETYARTIQQLEQKNQELSKKLHGWLLNTIPQFSWL